VIENHFHNFLYKKQIAYVSLDEITADSEKRSQYEEALKIDDNTFEKLSREDILSYLQSRMTTRQFEALRRYSEGQTFQEIAEQHNLSRAAIHQSYLRGLRKARWALKSLVWKD